MTKKRVQKKFKKESMTLQSQKDIADINKIVEKYGSRPVDYSQLRFGDARADELQASLDRIADARSQFEALDARVREAADFNFIEFDRMRSTEDGRAALHDAGLDLEAIGDEPFPPPEPPAEPEAGVGTDAGDGPTDPPSTDPEP